MSAKQLARTFKVSVVTVYATISRYVSATQS